MTQVNNTAKYDYSGAQVLVTGGTQGIGNAIANRFSEAGANVFITGTRADTSEYENDLSAFTYLQLEVTDLDAIKQLPEKLDNRLDVLVNNAGASLPGGQSEWDHDVFEQSVNINLNSAFHISHVCYPMLKKSELQGGAAIVSIASLTSFLANDFVPGYGAAKAGLAQLMKTFAITWAKDGIRANSIAAGMTQTRMTQMVQMIPEMNEPVLERTPMSRWGQPEEIAGCAIYLASSDASFLTGQMIVVDGGFSIVG